MAQDRIQIASATKRGLAARIVELHRFYGSRAVTTYRSPALTWVGNERLWTATITLAPVAEPDPAMLHIARIDSPARRSYGWLVRMQRHGERRVKWFADRGHGGRDLALAAAKSWRDEQLTALARVAARYEVPA